MLTWTYFCRPGLFNYWTSIKRIMPGAKRRGLCYVRNLSCILTRHCLGTETAAATSLKGNRRSGTEAASGKIRNPYFYCQLDLDKKAVGGGEPGQDYFTAELGRPGHRPPMNLPWGFSWFWWWCCCCFGPAQTLLLSSSLVYPTACGPTGWCNAHVSAPESEL